MVNGIWLLIYGKGKKRNGFTLIELLVAMSILAILSVIGLVAYTSTQRSARDGIRRQQIDVIASSIEAKKSPVDSTYTYTAGDLSNEFDATLVNTAQAGKDPLLTEYCVAVSTTTAPPSASAWVGSSDPYTCDTANWKRVPGDLTLATTKAWTICAKLENPPSGGPNSYCRSSLTR